MGTTLSDLCGPIGAKKERKRVGRGPGSGKGTTAGRGQKGQRSRSGGKMGAWFEGGQMPLQRRLPKRGFHNRFRVAYTPVNLKRLGELFQANDIVDIEVLKLRGVVPRRSLRWKILASGELSTPLVIKADACSAAARGKIEAAGGRVEAT